MVNQVVMKKSQTDSMMMVSETLENYYNALNNNNLEYTLCMIHNRSPAQLPTRQILSQLMNTFKLEYELLDTKYIGADDDYLYIRIKQKITKLEGPTFKDNISDSIFTFKMDEDTWRIWALMDLETSFI